MMVFLPVKESRVKEAESRCEPGGSNEIFGNNLLKIGQFLYPFSCTVFEKDSLYLVFHLLIPPPIVLFIHCNTLYCLLSVLHSRTMGNGGSKLGHVIA